MNLQILEEDESLQYLKKRKQVLEPQNPYEYCVAFGKITGLGTGRFLRMTKGFKMETFYEIQSFAKASNNQAIAINDWFKKYRASIKEI